MTETNAPVPFISQDDSEAIVDELLAPLQLASGVEVVW